MALIPVLQIPILRSTGVNNRFQCLLLATAEAQALRLLHHRTGDIIMSNKKIERSSSQGLPFLPYAENAMKPVISAKTHESREVRMAGAKPGMCLYKTINPMRGTICSFLTENRGT